MVIDVRNLSKAYNNKNVIENISFQLNKGDLLGVIGRSGCGKTTLLKCLSLLEKPDTGKIKLENTPIFIDGRVKFSYPKYRSQVSMVFQDLHLWSHKTILKNLMLTPVCLNLLSENEARKEALHYLDLLGLADKADEYPQDLSGGQKQRVAILRTVMIKPKVLLLDEITASLDPNTAKSVMEMLNIILEKSDVKAIIIASHDLQFLTDFTNNTLFIHNGVIAEAGSSTELLKQPKSKALRNFLGMN